MPAPHHSVFYRPDALPAAQPTASKHRRLERRPCFDLKMIYIIYHRKAVKGTVKEDRSKQSSLAEELTERHQ